MIQTCLLSSKYHGEQHDYCHQQKEINHIDGCTGVGKIIEQKRNTQHQNQKNAVQNEHMSFYKLEHPLSFDLSLLPLISIPSASQ